MTSFLSSLKSQKQFYLYDKSEPLVTKLLKISFSANGHLADNDGKSVGRFNKREKTSNMKQLRPNR